MLLTGNDCLMLFAHRRSGHHAILEWIACGIKYKVIHRNDVQLSKCAEWNFEKSYNGREPVIFLYNFESRPLTWVDDQDWDKYGEFKNRNLIFIYVERDPLNWMASTLKVR